MKPTMSGLPSGLRETLWKIAPAIPNATPTSSPVSTRGARSVSTMNALAGIALADDRRQHVAERERVVAGRDADDRDRERRDQQAGADDGGAAEDAQRHAVAWGAQRERRHSWAIRLCRTSAMNTGAPISAVTMPTSSSEGRTTTRPITSAVISRIGAKTAE